jgi:hypothetical protein
MRSTKNNLGATCRQADAGAALILVLLVLTSLMGLGMVAVYRSSVEMNIAVSNRLHSQALYAAEAGMEAAFRDMNVRLWNPAISTAVLQGTWGGDGLTQAVATESSPPPATAGGTAIPPCVDGEGDPETAAGKPFMTIYRHSAEGRELYNIPFPDEAQADERVFARRTNHMSPYMGRYTVYIRNDTAEMRLAAKTAGGSCTTDRNNTYVLRAVGLAPDNRTRVVLEMSIGGAANAADSDDDGPILPDIGPMGRNAGSSGDSTVVGVTVN